MCIVERYHKTVRRAYCIVEKERSHVSEAAAFQMAIKSWTILSVPVVSALLWCRVHSNSTIWTYS